VPKLPKYYDNKLILENEKFWFVNVLLNISEGMFLNLLVRKFTSYSYIHTYIGEKYRQIR
jgi:hypothetical protein